MGWQVTQRRKTTANPNVKVVHYSAETIAALRSLYIRLLEDFVGSEWDYLLCKDATQDEFDEVKSAESYYRRKFSAVTGIDILTDYEKEVKESDDTGPEGPD